MIILCERATMLEWTCCKIVWDKGDLLYVCVCVKSTRIVFIVIMILMF